MADVHSIPELVTERLNNVRSRRVMERLGMTHDPADDFGHPMFAPGHRLRAYVLYRLARPEWERARGGPTAAG